MVPSSTRYLMVSSYGNGGIRPGDVVLNITNRFHSMRSDSSFPSRFVVRQAAEGDTVFHHTTERPFQVKVGWLEQRTYEMTGSCDLAYCDWDKAMLDWKRRRYTDLSRVQDFGSILEGTTIVDQADIFLI